MKRYMLAVTVTDALGRSVSIEKNPERVAALIGSFADVWTLAGGQLCAAPEEAWEDFGLETEGTVNIGGAHSPNPELLFSSDPDLVLASAATASNVEMCRMLENAGITVVYFDVEHFYDYLDMLDICTDITMRKDLYEKNGLMLKEQIEKICQEYERKDVPEEERTVLLLRVSTGNVKAKGSQGTVLGEMLADMNCINIADSDTKLLENLSVESIICQDPYCIFAVAMGGSTENVRDSLNQLFLENPAWNSLKAVREGRVYVMDKELFHLKPNADWPLAYEKLYEILTQEQD